MAGCNTSLWETNLPFGDPTDVKKKIETVLMDK